MSNHKPDHLPDRKPDHKPDHLPDHLDEAVIRDMRSKSIDVELTQRILDRYNSGDLADQSAVVVTEIPKIDGRQVLDMRDSYALSMPRARLRSRLTDLGLDPGLADLYTDDTAHLRKDQLTDIGKRLFSVTALGVLNGGSATSYADSKKNTKLNKDLLDLLHGPFNRLSEAASGRPKGLTPAYLNPDGSFGASFLELRMRNLALSGIPMFQMTSRMTDKALSKAYSEYASGAVVGTAIQETGFDITHVRSAMQPLIAAYTHSSNEVDGKKSVFSSAYGHDGETLPLPGGHGQNFSVLKDVYESLLDEGKRFVYLGNVDNIGFTPDPGTLAYFALSDRSAAFEFTFRTPVDIKGGILVHDANGRLNCGDIGPAIDEESVLAAEASGKKILFNCATGLFDLQKLVSDLDRIIRDLPTRFSDQDKDAGRYSQAEQVTWEVLGILNDFLIFGVDKYRRFLSAKVLLETLMTSGTMLESPDYPTSDDVAKDTKTAAQRLHHGFEQLMREEYRMEIVDGRWVPGA